MLSTSGFEALGTGVMKRVSGRLQVLEAPRRELSFGVRQDRIPSELVDGNGDSASLTHSFRFIGYHHDVHELITHRVTSDKVYQRPFRTPCRYNLPVHGAPSQITQPLRSKGSGVYTIQSVVSHNATPRTTMTGGMRRSASLVFKLSFDGFKRG